MAPSIRAKKNQATRKIDDADLIFCSMFCLCSVFFIQFAFHFSPVSRRVGLLVGQYPLAEHLHRLVADAEGLCRDLSFAEEEAKASCVFVLNQQLFHFDTILEP